MSAVVRTASPFAVLAAAVVTVSIFAIPWYRHPAYAGGLTAWVWLPEPGLDLALAGVAAAVGLVGLVVGVRLPRPLAVLGALASVGLVGLVVYRLVHPPSLGLDFKLDGKPSIESGPMVALAAASFAAASLVAASAIVRPVKTCPDCAERIPARAEECPHCGHRFSLPRGWKRCAECAGKIRAEARFCKHCHAQLAGEPVPASAGPETR
jgi:hypothetical protein